LVGFNINLFIIEAGFTFCGPPCIDVSHPMLVAVPMLVRDERSLEFTVTRSLMKLLQTGSATVVSDCMNFFHFLPVSHQIDIRTAKFLKNFMCSKNYICTLFENKAYIYFTKISVRGNAMSLQF